MQISASSISAASDSFTPTIANAAVADREGPPGMAWVPGGEFSMGASTARYCSSSQPDFMSDAHPIHRVRVDGFWMDRTAVTNEQFARFVEATSYVTVAERPLDAHDVPRIVEAALPPGSTVFARPAQEVNLDDFHQWWRYVPGADWKHPEGPQSNLKGREKFPVIQVAYADAMAYAHWVGKRLPTEAEWEFAARGGLTGQPYAWGAILRPNGKWMANIWQGRFPRKDAGEDGFAGIAPVAKYPANGYGLYDMTGNVWQWCSDWYRADYYRKLVDVDRVVRNPQGPSDSFDPEEPDVAKRVQRGGSFLCSDQYCARYVVGSRGKGEPNTASNHVGFRCVTSMPAPGT